MIKPACVGSGQPQTVTTVLIWAKAQIIPLMGQRRRRWVTGSFGTAVGE